MCARQLCRASGSVWLKITADTTVLTPRRRSAVIIRGGLQAWNKCPCVIDYTLQANEINTAWIDWVEIVPGARRGRVKRQRWHADVQSGGGGEARCGFGFLAPVSSSPTIWFGPRWPWLQRQAVASRIWQARYFTISDMRKKTKKTLSPVEG